MPARSPPKSPGKPESANKPESPSLDLRRGTDLLQDTLCDVTKALSDCLSAARTATRSKSGASPGRQAEFENAAILLNASAKIGQALARIQGKAFEHHITVSHQISPSPAPLRGKAKQSQAHSAPTPPAEKQGSNADPA